MNLKKIDHKEVALRSIFILLVIGLILGYSKDKILIAFNLKQAEPDANIVSLKIDLLEQFPVWPSFICGATLTNVIAQAVKRGKSGAPDQLTDLPSNYVKPITTGSLSPGDWTGGSGPWPCFEFNTNKQLNFTPGVIDQVVLKASSNQLPDGNAPISQTGLLFGIFDAVRAINTVDPFVAPIPSRNTFTFTKNERYTVNGTYASYFFVNKQNIISTPLNDGNTVASFAYSPDTFLVMTYREQKPFTPYGLISSVGGFITYAVAAWVILFGRGKYRSWGLIQRYLLRNSPDATKNDNNNRLFPVFNEKSKPSDIESQTQLVVKSPGNDEPFRPTSAFYFSPNQQNFNPLLSPNSVITSSSLQSKDLNKLVDDKINQKLWFVEQTLSRHYLSGFRLRRYDVDPNNKLGTPYGEVNEPLTPPTARHSWQNLDSGINYNNQNTPPPPPQNLSHHSSQHFQKNNNSVSSFNPEEQRQQYPNVAVGQIPFEKKQKGSGIFQYSNDTTTTGVINNAHDGNYLSNVSVSMPPSSYIPNVPSYSDNSNIQSPLSQLQTSLPQGNHYMSFSNSQGQNQGSLRGPEER